MIIFLVFIYFAFIIVIFYFRLFWKHQVSDMKKKIFGVKRTCCREKEIQVHLKGKLRYMEFLLLSILSLFVHNIVKSVILNKYSNDPYTTI